MHLFLLFLFHPLFSFPPIISRLCPNDLLVKYPYYPVLLSPQPVIPPICFPLSCPNFFPLTLPVSFSLPVFFNRLPFLLSRPSLVNTPCRLTLCSVSKSCLFHRLIFPISFGSGFFPPFFLTCPFFFCLCPSTRAVAASPPYPFLSRSKEVTS